MEFWDQYKTPQWQKKRLEAMERAEFCCQRCGDSESQLHVHHKRYMKGRNVWEYGASELSVLCKECHTDQHDLKKKFSELLGRLHEEGFGEVVELTLAYCLHVAGPCAVDTSDLIDWTEDSHARSIGRLAAAFSNLWVRCEVIDAISDAVERINRQEGGVIVVPGVPTKNPAIAQEIEVKG